MTESASLLLNRVFPNESNSVNQFSHRCPSKCANHIHWQWDYTELMNRFWCPLVANWLERNTVIWIVSFVTQSWQCWHFSIGLINHFQCILIRRTLYKIVNIVNFAYYGKTRMSTQMSPYKYHNKSERNTCKLHFIFYFPHIKQNEHEKLIVKNSKSFQSKYLNPSKFHTFKCLKYDSSEGLTFTSLVKQLFHVNDLQTTESNWYCLL